MAARKSRKPWPTLTDPETGKEAKLDDAQAARAILVAIVERIGSGDAWGDDTYDEPTERVAVELLRKYRGPEKTIKALRDVAWLGEILAETSIAAIAEKLPKRSDGPVQSPLPRGEDLEIVQADAGETIAELWPVMRNRIEVTGGEKSQSIGLTLTWNPPTKNREGYFSVLGNLTVSTKRKTRSGQVTKKRGGAHQFVLFAEAADE